MKNGSISEQLATQGQQFIGEKKKEAMQSGEKENNISRNLDNKQDNKNYYNTGSDSILSILSLRDGNNYDATQAEELEARKLKKKKKKGIRR